MATAAPASPAQIEFIKTLLADLAALGAPDAGIDLGALTKSKASATITSLKIVRDAARAKAASRR